MIGPIVAQRWQVEAELRARSAYAQPERHYHDERHLDECLRELTNIHGLAERERRILRWAILWHDAVYEPGLNRNEDRSAELAERELAGCGVEAAEVAEVGRLIRLTERHRVEPSDRMGALLVSIDLSVLGSDPGRYAEYVEDVRKEYAHVPGPLWQAGRAAVLKRLLALDPLYPDAQFQAALGAQARANMQAELRTLGED
jgi:predicted metal-dependent HD superfamily phosphohydrolase